VHPGSFESCSDNELAPGLDNTAGSAQPTSAKLGVSHAVAVSDQVFTTHACFFTRLQVRIEGFQYLLQLPLFQLISTTFRPYVSDFTAETKDGLGSI
jgi:hypothetical protein